MLLLLSILNVSFDFTYFCKSLTRLMNYKNM